RCPFEAVIFAWPWETYLGNKALEAGVRVTLSPWVKFHSRMLPTTAKACGQYLNSILAVREAMGRGYDEALLLASDGSIAEGSGENIFLVHGGKLLTNDQRHSILLGVTRDAIIEIACNLGLPVEIRAIQVNDLLSADEAFFTGTAAEVTPIREVDGQPIGSGARGPLTAKIQQAFFAATSGRDLQHRHWLHLVASGPSKPVPATEATSLSETQRREIEHREGSAAMAREAAHCDPAEGPQHHCLHSQRHYDRRRKTSQSRSPRRSSPSAGTILFQGDWLHGRRPDATIGGHRQHLDRNHAV